MRKAIALLLTVFFIMAITLSIGIALKYIKNTQNDISSEMFLYQSSMVFNDVVKMLKNSKDLNQIKDEDSLKLFLENSSSIPFKSHGLELDIEINSARGRVNANIFNNQNRLDRLKAYLSQKGIDIEYANMLSDLQSGIKIDGSYNTDIFEIYPELFRDYISSYEELRFLNQIYINRFHSNIIEKLDVENFFYISKDKDTAIDLNFASKDVFRFLTGCGEERAIELTQGDYKNMQDLKLTKERKKEIAKFKISFYEPILDVKISVRQGKNRVKMQFEYDITKKSINNITNFVKK